MVIRARNDENETSCARNIEKANPCNHCDETSTIPRENLGNTINQQWNEDEFEHSQTWWNRFVISGALVHRLDPGIIPFRKASECRIHVSGGEFNVAANLADCFRMQTAIASAMVDYPIGDLIAERVRAMGVKPFYKLFPNDGVTGPNMATVYSDRGLGVRAPVVFYNRSNEAAARLKPGDFDWNSIFAGGLRWFHSGGIFAALSATTPELIVEGMKAAKAAGAVRFLRSEFPRETVENLRWVGACPGNHSPDCDPRRCPGRQRRRLAKRPRCPWSRSSSEVQTRPIGFLRDDRSSRETASQYQDRGDDLARGPLDQPA